MIESGRSVLAYRRPGTLHRDAGKTKRARAVWARGLHRFPAGEEPARALELLEED